MDREITESSCYNCRFFRVDEKEAGAICRLSRQAQFLGSMFGFNSRACAGWKKEKLPRKMKKKAKKLLTSQGEKTQYDIDELPF